MKIRFIKKVVVRNYKDSKKYRADSTAKFGHSFELWDTCRHHAKELIPNWLKHADAKYGPKYIIYVEYPKDHWYAWGQCYTIKEGIDTMRKCDKTHPGAFLNWRVE